MTNTSASNIWLISLTSGRVAKVLAGALALIGAAGFSVGGQAEPVWNVFSGRGTLVVPGAKDGKSSDGRVWYRVSKERRTIASGSVIAHPDGHIEIPVKLAEMKQGVVLPLEAELRAGSEEGPLLRSGPLWVFSEQPVSSEGSFKASRPLVLYDPEGRTDAALRAIGLSCDVLERPALLEAVTNALIVVGEGVSLEGERGLAELLAGAVARGNRVLLLAPCDGELKPPAAWRALRAGNAQDVLREPVSAKYPYRLDLANWPPDGNAVQKRFRLEASRDGIVFAVTSEAGCEAVGWDDVASGGCIRACGLGIIKKWNETPAARWLFMELVKQLENEE